MQFPRVFNLFVYIALLCFLSACSWAPPSNTTRTTTNAGTRVNFPPASSTTPSPSPPPQSGTENQTVFQSRQKFNTQLLLQVLNNQIGRPYRYGGSDPSGFDCSGLVQYSFSQLGINLPRSTREQMQTLARIDRHELQAGDLAFFQTGANQYHVGIMIDEHNFIHAPSSGKTVSTSNFSNPYWKKNFLLAARY